MTAEEWVRAFEAKMRKYSEKAYADIPPRGTPEEKARASTTHVVYNLISADVKEQLEAGFDNPDADQVAWTTDACTTQAEAYQALAQMLEALLPKVPPEAVGFFSLAIHVTYINAQVFAALATASTQEGRQNAEQILSSVQENSAAMRDAAILMTTDGSNTVQ